MDAAAALPVLRIIFPTATVSTMSPKPGAFPAGRSRIRIATSIAAGLRCTYRWVVVRSASPAHSWIDLAGTPFIARCEQNV